jgi:hypothetical protein
MANLSLHFIHYKLPLTGLSTEEAMESSLRIEPRLPRDSNDKSLEILVVEGLAFPPLPPALDTLAVLTAAFFSLPRMNMADDCCFLNSPNVVAGFWTGLREKLAAFKRNVHIFEVIKSQKIFKSIRLTNGKFRKSFGKNEECHAILGSLCLAKNTALKYVIMVNVLVKLIIKTRKNSMEIILFCKVLHCFTIKKVLLPRAPLM